MPFIPLPNGVRAVLEFNLAGELVVNVFHFTCDSAITTVNLTALGEVLADMWANDLVGLFSTDMSLQQIVLTDVSTEDSIQVTYTTDLPEPGVAGGDAAPNNVAVCSTYRTERIGRSYRGRTYWAGLDETLIVNNTPNSSIVTNILTALADMIIAADVMGFTFVVASYRHNNAPRVTGVATPITALTMDTRSDSQRRRLPD